MQEQRAWSQALSQLEAEAQMDARGAGSVKLT